MFAARFFLNAPGALVSSSYDTDYSDFEESRESSPRAPPQLGLVPVKSAIVSPSVHAELNNDIFHQKKWILDEAFCREFKEVEMFETLSVYLCTMTDTCIVQKVVEHAYVKRDDAAFPEWGKGTAIRYFKRFSAELRVMRRSLNGHDGTNRCK